MRRDRHLDSEVRRVYGSQAPKAPLKSEDTDALNLLAAKAALTSSQADQQSAFWSRVSAFVGILTAVTVAFGLFQFNDERRAWRVDRTYKLIEFGVNDKAADASLALTRLFLRYQADEIGQLTDFYDFAAKTDPRTPALYDVVILHWEMLGTCLENQFCEQDVVKSYVALSVGARKMVESGCPHILAVRRNSPNYAAAAQRVLDFDCGGESKNL